MKDSLYQKAMGKIHHLLRSRRWKSESPEQIFTEIYRKNHWKHPETFSGPGSAVEYSKQLIHFFPKLLRSLEIKNVVDLACGDFNWLKEIDLKGVNYTGIDIVQDIVDRNSAKYGKKNIHFQKLNIIDDPLPAGELAICRDVLVHLTNAQVTSVLKNLRNSTFSYLLATTFPFEKNRDIVAGMWRPLNLQEKPFQLPAPVLLINEYPYLQEQTAHHRFIGLWKLKKLN